MEDTNLPVPLSFQLDSTEVITNLFMPNEQPILYNNYAPPPPLPLTIVVHIHSLHNFFVRHSDGAQELIDQKFALLSSHAFYGHLPLVDNFLGGIVSDMSLREYLYNSCESYYFAGSLEMTLDLTMLETYVHDYDDQDALYAAMIGESFDDEDHPPPVVPADKSAVEELEKVLFGSDDSMTTTQCAVCLVEFKTGLEITRMPCRHYFHTECIQKWLETSYNCPLCRFSLPH